MAANNRSSHRLRARWVLPVSSPPVENAVVAIEAGVITAVEPARRNDPAEDLGQVVLLPGCVNAHTHLEFSDLEAPLGDPESCFADWIRSVVRWRADAAEEASSVSAIQRGIAECRRHGVTAIGDISTSAEVSSLFCRCSMPGVSFLELLGFDLQRTEEHVRRGAEFVSGLADRPGLAGLSPHAPYTINLHCLKQISALSSETRIPLAMHLAESSEELRLLEDQTGELVDLLEGWGVWHRDVMPPGISVADYLQVLSTAHRALVIHGNYLRPEEVELLARHRDRMSVVYCPRTHAYFGHEPYQLTAFLAAGVVVALGTDSRASNPDLSLFGEMRHVMQAHSQMDPAAVVKMGTCNGARALGHELTRGTLDSGKAADIAVLAMREGDNDPYEAIFAGEPPKVLRVYQQGLRQQYS